MGDEQQPIARLGMGFTPAAIVQRRDHRFARTGGRYHQIAVIPAHFPLRSQLIQDGLLIGIGADVKQERLLLTLPFFAFQRFCQPGMGVGSVDFKFIRVPIAVEGGVDLPQGIRLVHGRQLQVPFQAIAHGGVGQVGGAHIGGGKAGIPVKHIGLGVKPGAGGIVADFDFRIGQRGQLVDGLHFRCAHIRSGDDPQQPAPGSKRLEGIDDQPQAAPFHEGHQHVDPVGAGNLLLQLGEHFRFMGRPGE